MQYSIQDLLLEIKKTIENTAVEEKHLISKVNSNGFEILFSDIIKKIKLNNISFKENYGHHFPDVDIHINNEKYGLELKSRTDGSWINNGGSVFESISSKDYKEIFLLFGTINKKENELHYKVRFAPYWTVTESIKVTHKPRYFINMNTKESIFKSQSEYDVIREMNELEKNKYVQQILKENTNKAQWYISENENISPTLINNLKQNKRNELISEALILYPQDLLKIKSDYTRITKHLISTYFYYSPSTRDLFSAGGKFSYNNVLFPKKIEQFKKHNDIIIKILNELSPDFKELVYKSWNEVDAPIKKINVVEDYKIILNKLGNDYISQELVNANINQLTDIIFENN